MIKMICDNCNCEADYFGGKLLTKEDMDKLAIQYNTEFKNKVMTETYICRSCGGTRDYIHMLYE